MAGSWLAVLAHGGWAQTAPLVPLAPLRDDAAGLPGSDPAFVAAPDASAQGRTPADSPPAADAGRAGNRVQRERAAAQAVRAGAATAPRPAQADADESAEGGAAADEVSLPSLPPLPPLLDLPSPGLSAASAVARPKFAANPPPRPYPVPAPPPPNAPITLALHQVDLAAAIQAFAEFTGLNIVTSDHVRGTITLTLSRVPWRRAFDTLLDANGLAMQQHGNVIWVAPAGEIATREKQRFEANARIAELEPLTSRMFVLQYQRAEDVRKLLAGGGNQQVLSKRGTAMADPRTDHLFVTDAPQRIAQVAALIKAIDMPPRQVLIESRIVEADESFERNLGARLALIGRHPEGVVDPAHGIHGGPAGNVYDLPAGGIGGYPAATLGVTLFSAGDSRELMLELSALEAEGHGRIVSSPRVVTADRVRALIEQGTELPYQAKVDTGVSAVQFRRAGLKLEVIPHITPDHHVMLDVDVTKDSVGAETTAGPAINTKHVQTQVQVENGGTVAIGGIYTEDERNDAARVPWLGRLPVIGFLFRRQAVAHSKNELMIFITPTEIGSLAPALAAIAAPTDDAPRAVRPVLTPAGAVPASAAAISALPQAVPSAQDGEPPPTPAVPAIPVLHDATPAVQAPVAEWGAAREKM